LPHSGACSGSAHCFPLSNGEWSDQRDSRVKGDEGLLHKLRADPGSLNLFRVFCEPTQHESDHSEADEGGGGAGMALKVVSQSTVAADPAEGTLDNASLRQHDKAVSVTAADDQQLPPTRPLHRRAHLRALVYPASPITRSRKRNHWRTL
jgi:hypothetical protein